MDDDELVNYVRKTLNNSEELFLPMLLSNSALALDRHVSESLTVPPIRYIHVQPNERYKTLTITDNGVGMTHDDLLNLVGTIASSTAKEAVADLNRIGITHADLLNLGTIACSKAKLSKGEDVACLNRIWQSGFGFFFAFLVADKVVFRTKHYNDKEYALYFDLKAGVSPTIHSDTLGLYRSSGSMMTLCLKEDQLHYLELPRLRDLISKSSSLISHEINLIYHENSFVDIPSFPFTPKDMTTINFTSLAHESWNPVKC